MEQLALLRKEMDEIDRELTQVFLRRLDVAAEIGAYKQQIGLPGLDQRRELQVIRNASAQTEDAGRKLELAKLYENILALSRQEQRMKAAGGEPGAGYQQCKLAMTQVRQPVKNPRVVYQGEPGAYSEMSCIDFFGPDCNCKGLVTFDDVFKAVAQGDADYAVVPIENSSTGAIRQVYELLGEYQFYVVGENTVKVEHCLIAPHGASLDTITHVYSHEQGFFQSEEYLAEHDAWRRHAVLNTAAAAQMVASCGARDKAAVCSRRAAQLYGLEVLQEGINTSKENYTRFFVVSKYMEIREGSDKISLMFTLPHESGTLNSILGILAVHQMNMLRLESRPMPGKGWEYRFFVDVEGSLRDEELDSVLFEVLENTLTLRILGNYKKGE